MSVVRGVMLYALEIGKFRGDDRMTHRGDVTGELMSRGSSMPAAWTPGTSRTARPLTSGRVAPAQRAAAPGNRRRAPRPPRPRARRLRARALHAGGLDHESRRLEVVVRARVAAEQQPLRGSPPIRFGERIGASGDPRPVRLRRVSSRRPSAEARKRRSSSRSTVPRAPAREPSRAALARLDYRHVDTGAMYRAVAWKALREGVDLDDEAAVAALGERAAFDLERAGVVVDGHDVARAIRTPEIDAAAPRSPASQRSAGCWSRGSTRWVRAVASSWKGATSGRSCFPMPT